MYIIQKKEILGKRTTSLLVILHLSILYTLTYIVVGYPGLL